MGTETTTSRSEGGYVPWAIRTPVFLILFECFACVIEPAHGKGILQFYGLWFFKCACAIPYLGYRHAFLPAASSRSLLHVNKQQKLWQDCTYASLWFFRYACAIPCFGYRHAVFACSFLKISTTYLHTTKALARLCLCAGSSEPLLMAYVISTLFSCADSTVPVSQPKLHTIMSTVKPV